MDNIELLKNLGFTEYEARTYIALSELGPSTAKEIADYSKLPKNKTYEMLNRLEKKKKILSLPVTPRKYRILDINQLKENVEKQKKSVKKLEKSLNKFIEESSKPKLKEFKEIFWIIRGKQAIIKKMEAQNRLTKKESLSINRLSYASPSNLKSMKQALDQGAISKMLVPLKNANMKNIKKWKSIGVQIRNYDESKFGPIGTRLGIYDKKIVRITFGEPDVSREEDYITLWAESPYLSNILRNYFLSIWKKSEKF